MAYRVLQEMLTNAVKHGRRDEPGVRRAALARRLLSDELRIEVRNTGASDAPTQRRRRLAGSTACASGSRRSAAGSTCAAARTTARRRSR